MIRWLCGTRLRVDVFTVVTFVAASAVLFWISPSSDSWRIAAVNFIAGLGVGTWWRASRIGSQTAGSQQSRSRV